MADNGKSESMVKRFSGETQEPQKDYKRWKRWSKAYLIVQRAKGVDESALGAMLFTLLDGVALRAFDSVELDSLEQAGGQDIIYQVLDDRFPEEAIHDRLGDVLDGIFDLKVEKNESTAAFTRGLPSRRRSQKELSYLQWLGGTYSSASVDCRQTRRQW